MAKNSKKQPERFYPAPQVSFFRRLFGRRRATPPVVRRETVARPEPLESRIAPATLVNPHMVTYQDLAHETVTVKSSLPIFTSSNYNTLLTFSTASVGNATPQQLQEINLLSLAQNQVAGDSISVAVASGTGADVGYIVSGYNLGNVLVQGDLGRIAAGDTSSTASHHLTGLSSLTVDTIGAQLAAATQPASSSPSLNSVIEGALGSLTVSGDVTGANIQVNNNVAGSSPVGNIGSIHIGGSLVGQSGASTGAIGAAGNISSIVLGGSIEGGSGTSSGTIIAGGKIGSLTALSVNGFHVTTGPSTGQGQGSGSVTTHGGIGSLTLTGSASGQGLIGGDGSSSGAIVDTSLNASLGAAKIAGQVAGGAGNSTGEISFNSIGSISIGNGIVGGAGTDSGFVSAAKSIGNLVISTGGIAGGSNTSSGGVGTAGVSHATESIGTAVIHGDIAGGTMAGAGQVAATDFHSITVYGSLTGSDGNNSGAIISSGNISSATIHGGITGGNGDNSGQINAATLGSVTVDGVLQGGTLSAGYSGSAKSSASGDISASGAIGHVSLGGIAGGGGATSGSVVSSGDTIGTVTIQMNNGTNGSVLGGSGDNSGQLSAASFGKISIAGALTGGAGTHAGSILSTDSVTSISLGELLGTGIVSVGNNLGSFTLSGGSGTVDSGMLEVVGNAGNITIKGDVTGGSASAPGELLIGGALKNLNMTGKLQGGSTDDTGSIFAGLDGTSGIGSATISGGLTGGGGMASGELSSGGAIARVIAGAIQGGVGTGSGSIVTGGALGSVTINGGITGGAGQNSGQILSGSTIASVIVTGALDGGTATGSGAILSHSLFTTSGDTAGTIGSVTVKGGITGGTASDTGEIAADGDIQHISITGDVSGTSSSDTGAILAGLNPVGDSVGNITSLNISGSLVGASVSNTDLNGSGYIDAAHIGSLTIGGALKAGSVSGSGTVTGDGAIVSSQDIGSLSIGSIAGDVSNRALVSAVGQAKPGKNADLAFGSIHIGGDVSYGDILAGYDTSMNPVNGSASIGHVTVKGNWAGSNMAAGVTTGSASDFGQQGNALISSDPSPAPQIQSVTIAGQVGSESTGEHFGFVAEQVGAFSVGGHALNLSTLKTTPIPLSADTTLEEVSG